MTGASVTGTGIKVGRHSQQLEQGEVARYGL